MEWVWPALGLLGGIALLVWGADRFVEGAAATANNLSISPLLIGLTVIALGTSAPEILVSLSAALKGQTSLAVGNAFGSNIANIALVLGVCALIIPLTVKSGIVKLELPLLMFITLLSGALLYDQQLSMLDGIILLSSLALVMTIIIYANLRQPKAAMLDHDFDDDIPQGWSTKKSLLWLIVGLAILLIGSEILVISAVKLATMAGISQLVIGLSIVAIGTSLPELAASVASVLKGEDDMAIGNVVGSNMFNITAVLGTAAITHPSAIPPAALERDWLLMAGLTTVLFAALLLLKQGKLGRVFGLIFCGTFITYQGLLFV